MLLKGSEYRTEGEEGRGMEWRGGEGKRRVMEEIGVEIKAGDVSGKED